MTEGVAGNEHRREVQRLVTELAGLEPGRREVRLAPMRWEDPGLYETVRALIERYDRGEPIGGLLGELEAELIRGRYRLHERLGEGGMGVVYRAEDGLLGIPVALKFLPPHLHASEDARRRFLAEARAAAAIDHPNVCRIYEVGEAEDGRLYLAMACYEGETLQAKIARGPLPVGEAADVARQIARGLEAAHRKGIVHRDLKPSNVLVTGEGAVKLLDFGIAKAAGGGDLTKPGGTVGTASYMSPEQLRGAEADPRTDLWALGVVLYEMVAGRRPFEGAYEAALAYAIVHEAPAPLRAGRPDVPAALAAVVERCLEKDPARRYASAEEVEQALGEALGAEAGSAEVAAVRSPVRHPLRMGRTVRIGGPIALLLLLGAPGLFPGVRTSALGWIGLGGMPEEKRIAVLPFQTTGEDPSAEAFGNGLVEVLASTLTQLEQFEGTLWVVPTSEVRSRNVMSAEAARQAFGVNLVVTGSVHRDASRVRSTLNLVDAGTLRQLRSAVSDVPVSELGSLHREMIGELEGMLGLELGAEPRRALMAGSTPDSDAYDAYVQGLGYLQRYESEQSLVHAIGLFERSLEEDPSFALAHAGLGEAYWRRFEETRDGRWVAEAEAHSRRALALADGLAPVHVTLGLIYAGTGRVAEAERAFGEALRLEPTSAAAYRGLAKAYEAHGDLKAAEATYRKAIELRPDYWGGYNDLGVFFARHSRFEDAIGPFQRVIELTPDNARGYSNLGGIYYHLARWDEALTMYERSLASAPSYIAYANLGTLYYYRGRYTDAAAAYERALALNGQDYRVWGGLGWSYYWQEGGRSRAEVAFQQAVSQAEEQRAATDRNDPSILAALAGYYAHLGHPERARAMLEEVARQAPEDAALLFEAAFAYELLGMRDEALGGVGAALRRGYPAAEVEREPSLASLRQDPRFEAVLRGEVP